MPETKPYLLFFQGSVCIDCRAYIHGFQSWSLRGIEAQGVHLLVHRGLERGQPYQGQNQDGIGRDFIRPVQLLLLDGLVVRKMYQLMAPKMQTCVPYTDLRRKDFTLRL